MNENKPDATGTETMIANWMKSATDFLGVLTRMYVQPTTGPDPSSQMGASRSAKNSLDAAIRNWQAVSSAMSTPESMQSLFKGVGAMPDILAKMAQNTVSGYMQLQQKWLDRCGRIGEKADAYSFEQLDENMFRAWTDMYETEFQQFFHIPQLGLTRGYQEKFNQAVDKYNIYNSSMSEFVRVFSLPISNSVAIMQEKLGEMAENGALPDDSQKYYQLWIKILEGLYMKLFQSPEYNQVLANTLNAISDFSATKDAVIQDMMSVLPVPSRKEIDDLEREVYELKKRIRTIEKNR
ncbi:MAG: poly(R)-hydroxyalkanoic acid synthase subunit PhaE [Deltaproteobacteria bacterium]|jgi:polyhydroxyalkanoate synthase subunit PhaE